ncbi:MAG: yceI 1 [Burkholderiales bacterium]|jgi:polyisoprenoid-binding protein YceI|nr:yceI 1 [Burkholderiales bacterium]
MSKKILIVILFVIGSFVYSKEVPYNLDPFHTSVTWSISHFGFSHPSGKWMVESGTITLDEQNLKNSKVIATIQIDDINSGIPKLDQELIKEQFFDTAKFPAATFVSTRVQQKSASKLVVTGNLTLHGVTRSVPLFVTVNKIAIHPISMQKVAGFTATAKIKRSDFGMKAYLPGLGDMVDLLIEVEASVPKPEDK